MTLDPEALKVASDAVAYAIGPPIMHPETPEYDIERQRARIVTAGIDDRTVADAMGWAVADVEAMRRIYVDREAVVSAAILRMRKDRQ